MSRASLGIKESNSRCWLPPERSSTAVSGCPLILWVAIACLVRHADSQAERVFWAIEADLFSLKQYFAAASYEKAGKHLHKC